VRTRVYIDGFNLFYGLKQHEKQGACYRWLDLNALCQLLLPSDTIDFIRYFTAIVSGRLDPQGPIRQQVYLRALRTLPNLSIHLGQFISGTMWLPLVNPFSAIPPSVPADVIDVSRNGLQVAFVTKMEEKGSDVNLATYMLLDCFQNAFDQAIVISNDSDLAEPIRVIRRERGCKVGILNPTPRYSKQMEQAADFYTRIEEKHLQASQFPQTLRDRKGTITKPSTW
jgi:uncharacterized LabA/DUF88 family protein